MLVATELGTVECIVTGEGPAVLALHGAMGGCDQSLLLARAAIGVPGFQFIAVSRPGYLGTSLALGKEPEQQADLCAALLDSLGIAEAAVIAVSGGGQCALQFALRHPGKCRRLVLVSACTAQQTIRLPFRYQIIKLVARLPFLEAAMRRRAASRPEDVARRSIPDPEMRARTLNDPEAGPMLIEFQLSTLDRLAERMPGTQNDIAQSQTPFHYPVEQISAPVLLVHGTADQIVPVAQSRALAARLPRAETLIVEGGEHVTLFTHLHVVRARVREFIAAD